MIIAPSILNIPTEQRNNKVKEYLNAGIIMMHIDIMDDIFVPNKTEGVEILEPLKDLDFIKDVHLMVSDVKKYAEEFVKAKADIITFHVEAVAKPLEIIKYLKKHHIRVGISIKPKTEVSAITAYLKEVDQVLVMSVEPGFGGQAFMPQMINKVEELNNLRMTNDNYNYQIEVDGGINIDNAKLLANAGANIVVMGTYLYKQEDVRKTVLEVDAL
jgi:ribulose-phosphate 3-epimerase